MALGDLFDKLKSKVTHEVQAAKGKAGKDKLFTAENTYPNEAAAREAFAQAREKLYDVNGWSELEGLNSTFTLHDAQGQPLNARLPEPGQLIRIELPGTKTENWVEVTDRSEGADFAEFVVHPTEKPSADSEGEVKHFFQKEASSTFRVELEGSTIRAFEIGRNEKINNRGEEAGARAALNTAIAEGGWAFFQKIQWDKITRYLVHKEEPAD